MIGLFVKIPFHAQVRSSEQKLADELARVVDGVVESFAATRHSTDESFLLTFDEASRPCRLRAAEAARCLSAALAGMGARLYGWAILLDSGAADPDEALGVAKLMWFGIQGDGLYVSARSKAYFSDYFVFGPVGAESEAESKACIPVLGAIYARPTLPIPETVDESPAAAVEKLVDALGALGVGQEGDVALAALGPGRGPRLCLDEALRRLYGESSSRFLRLRASVAEDAPYGPIAGAFGASASAERAAARPGALLPSAERVLLEELNPIIDFLLRSPYRSACSLHIDMRMRLCAAAALRSYAREMRGAGLPGFVILEGIERFPAPSLTLVLGLAADAMSSEGIVILASGAELPRSWRGIVPRCLEVAGPSPSEIADAALRAAEALCSAGISAPLALAAAGDPFRLRLALRLIAAGRTVAPASSTEALAAEALTTFPREYAELLLCLRLSEGVLTDDCAEGFLADTGYVSGIRAPIFDALASLGFITAERRPRIAHTAAAARIAEALPDKGAAVGADFARRLLRLQESGRIIPSYALFRRMKAEAELEGPGKAASLALDCIGADEVYGPSEPPGSEPVQTPLEPMKDFLRAYSRADRAPCLESVLRLESAAARIERGEELVGASAVLARAAFEYADGRAQSAAPLAKNALIGLHSLDARRSEARAHRLLGLCSMAQEQVHEGSDYLANAFDLASAIPDPLECILSALAESSAAFALGDLGRAWTRAESAAGWAAIAFRADWESAAAFAMGRAALETGRYAEAEGYFGEVRAIARVYGQAEAARRAEIWAGRAASFAGEERRARDILGRFGDDAEALWFLSEIEAWAEAPGEAIPLVERALALVPAPGFSPADSFDWSSGYSSLEGRSVGFGSGKSYLRDQIEAFGEFAAGMAAPETEGQARAARLAAMVREERLAALHPAAHLYLFYRYLILERAAPSSMDGATALSKAFKALQTRSKRMGESSYKDGFLATNRWNRSLIEAARARKLI